MLSKYWCNVTKNAFSEIYFKVYSISFLLSGWFKTVTMQKLKNIQLSVMRYACLFYPRTLRVIGVAYCVKHTTKTCAWPAFSESQITGSPQHIFLLHISIHISHSYRQSSSTQLTNPNNKKQLIQAINFPSMTQSKVQTWEQPFKHYNIVLECFMNVL